MIHTAAKAMAIATQSIRRNNPGTCAAAGGVGTGLAGGLAAAAGALAGATEVGVGLAGLAALSMTDRERRYCAGKNE